ncbi:MAG: PAS domain S-box protein [Myxococcota bacterium]|nr:PAS domain S-box protein [Myxococcota bacterium]
MQASNPFPLLDAALDGVIVMSGAGRILELNASAETTFGLRREDVLGRELAEVIIPERLRESHRRGLARYLETGASAVIGKRLQMTATRADGRELPVELTITLAVVDDERVFVGFVRDLTEATAATRRVERIHESAAALAAARRVMDVGHAVMSAGVDALGAETAVFVRPVGDALGIVAAVGVPEDVVASFQSFTRDTPSPAAAVFRTGVPEWVEDESAFRARYGHTADALKSATAAAAALPLRVGGEVVAAVAFRFAERRSFAASDRALIETLAVQAAQALDRVLGYEQELEGRRKLDALADLTTTLAATLSERDVAEAVSDRGMLAMAADTCVLYRLEADGSLALVAERGCSPVIVEKIRRIDAGSSNPSAEMVRSGRTVWIESAAEYDACFPSLARLRVPERRVKAFWSVPLMVEGAAIGLLAMGFYEERRFSPSDRVFVETFAQNAAQALRRAQRLESETRLRHSLETTLRSIGDAVIATNLSGAVTFLNPVAERLTGWTQEEALGRPVHEVFRIVNEETRAVVESPVERVLREGGVVGLANHTVLVSKDGRETPIDDSGAPIREASDTMMGVVLVFRDVSAKKLDERRRAFLSDAVTVMAVSLDYQATLARVAGFAVPMIADWCTVDVVEPEVGLRRVATAHVDPLKVGLAQHVNERYPPDPNGPTGVFNVLRTGASELYAEIPDRLLVAAAQDEEHLRLLRDLRLRSAMIVPLTARGQTLGAITFVYAESGRTFTPGDVAFAEDLARRAAVAIDNARLYAAEQQARQVADAANRVKDEFLATVSHELRTPLNAIMGWAKMLGVAAADPDRVARAIMIIERNAVAMARLIEDLLDVSRIVSGKVRLEVEAVDIEKVLEATAESAKPAAAAKGVTIDVSTERSAPMQADPKRIEQIVANLLSNAVKFSNRAQRVDVRLRGTASAYEIRVTDSGRGIDPRFLPHVFDPFRQADPTITRRHGGLGLGLAITRELVELHGGTIEAKSEGEGRGATFVVTLPRHPRSSPRDANSDGSAGERDAIGRVRELEGLRVLVVDDEEDARVLVRTILEECGCSVRVASSAAEAMGVIESETLDLLVSDIGMPVDDGYSLMTRVRSCGMPRGALPAIALTAFTRSEDRRRALDAGFARHVAKPVDPAELVAVVASFVRSMGPRAR